MNHWFVRVKLYEHVNHLLGVNNALFTCAVTDWRSSDGNPLRRCVRPRLKDQICPEQPIRSDHAFEIDAMIRVAIRKLAYRSKLAAHIRDVRECERPVTAAGA